MVESPITIPAIIPDAHVALPLARERIYDCRTRILQLILQLTQAAKMSESKDLRNMGLKATFPRLKVLDLFQNSSQRHLSAEDVYKLLIAENTDIGLATVYRVLTQFEQAGLLVRHHFEGGKAVFELNEREHHDHLVCLQCGRVEEFHDPEIERRQAKVAKDRGFDIHDHSLYLYADCVKPGCPNKNSE
jgi:Fur family ferric uptake transcriptional regulator